MYSAEVAATLNQEFDKATRQLNAQLLNIVAVAESVTDPRVKEHLNHGAGRRVKLLRCCIANVFNEFPPETTAPAGPGVIDGVQINLQAFVMNLSGLFDNLAWAFVLRHDLVEKVGGRNGIGMFRKGTQDRLSPELKKYLTSPTMVSWHGDYLKTYRDSLAHRIPLYVPPVVFTNEQHARYAELEKEKVVAIKEMRWERLDEIYDEQANIGSACHFFLYAISDELETRPLRIHPQLLCDVATVNEFLPLFFEHWNFANIE